MSYTSKPSYIKRGSILHEVLKTIDGKKKVSSDDFGYSERNDGLYPAIRHGFVKVSKKQGTAELTKSGKKLVASAR